MDDVNQNQNSNPIQNQDTSQNHVFVSDNNKKSDNFFSKLRPGKLTAFLSVLLIVAAIPVAMHLLSTPTNLPTRASLTIIAQDTFQRGNQVHWGVSSDGHLWGGDANITNLFSISNNTAQVINTGDTTYTAILGSNSKDTEILFTGSLSSYASASDMGAVIRWKDTNNWYKAYINGTNFMLLKRVNGSYTTLKTTPFAAAGGTNYSLRFRIDGTTLNAKIWATAHTEPSNWMITAADTSFSSGFSGLRMTTHSGKANFTSFSASQIFSGTSSPTPTSHPTTTPTNSPTHTPTPTPHPTITPTNTPSHTPTPTPLLTATPTNTPVPSATPTQAPSITSTMTPTPTTPTPTGTPNPNGTTLSVTIGLHGIGSGGDNVKPDSIGNQNPQHPTRTLIVTILDLSGNQIQQSQGPITFTSSSGFFTGTVNAGSLPTGDYQFKVASNGFLQKQIPNVYHVTSGQTTTLPQVALVNGDLNNDNQVDALDYSIFVSCFGTKQNTPSCTMPPTQGTTGSAGADMDDTGTVDGFDYNLFARELSVQRGG